MNGGNFKNLFKQYRLRSGFATLDEFGKALAEKGLIFENSLFSRWQRGTRIPKDRKLLLALIKIFIERKGISSVKDANLLLESAGQGYLTESELSNVSTYKTPLSQIPSPKKLLEFVTEVGKAKQILRTGWVREKIKNPESVAEHSFRVTVLAMVTADKLGLDKEKLVEMAIVHDLGEIVTGDLVWSRGKILDIKKRTEKENLEKKGIKKILGLINLSEKYLKLYEEMSERKTEEAKIFWQLDKLEMAIQALEYERSDQKNLEEFFINANIQIDSPFLKKIMREIIRQRNVKIKS